MDGSKPFWASKTIWANLVTVAVGLGTSFGLFSPDQGEVIVTQFPELMVGIATVVTGLVGMYGRFTATKETTST